MRDSFIFYRSFYEAIKDLPRDIQGEIYTAIMEYSLYGNETENLKPVARSIFTLIKPQIDVNNKRFDNGCKGGRPKPNDNQEETKPKPNDNQEETKPKPNDNQEETKPKPNYNDNKNKNVNEYIPPIIPQGDVAHSDEHHETIDYNALMNTFNRMFENKLPRISSMTDKRKKSVKARASEHGKTSIIDVFNNVAQSAFLLGRNNQNWRCDFDWIFKPTNFIKILEGNYNGTRLSKNQQDSEQRKRDSVLAVATTVREAAAKKRKELEAEGIIDQIP
ncbi:DUF6291 domain-containing protein [Bacteroides fragilis]|jgi:hypothetical protein